MREIKAMRERWFFFSIAHSCVSITNVGCIWCSKVFYMLTPLKMQRQREAIVCFHHELELHHFLFAAVVYDIKIAIEKRLISSLLVGNICFGSFIRTIYTIASSVFRANTTHAHVHTHIRIKIWWWSFKERQTR